MLSSQNSHVHQGQICELADILHPPSLVPQ